jgi:hypothetical protein
MQERWLYIYYDINKYPQKKIVDTFIHMFTFVEPITRYMLRDVHTYSTLGSMFSLFEVDIPCLQYLTTSCVQGSNAAGNNWAGGSYIESYEIVDWAMEANNSLVYIKQRV